MFISLNYKKRVSIYSEQYNVPGPFNRINIHTDRQRNIHGCRFNCFAIYATYSLPFESDAKLGMCKMRLKNIFNDYFYELKGNFFRLVALVRDDVQTSSVKVKGSLPFHRGKKQCS